MLLEPKNLTWTLMLLFLPGALCSEWKLVNPQPHICAVKGSSVVILCSFYYPDTLRVERLMWGHVRSQRFSGRFISDKNIEKFATRFQYIGDMHHNCSLRIHHVEHNDAGKYAFRFITDSRGISWTGPAGSLEVVDLNISMTKPDGSRATKEGDSVNLTCINSCDGRNISSAFTWFKNGKPFHEGAVLYLSNISSKSSGNYTCSLKTHKGTTSGVINIDVEYGPKNTSVSGRPSTEVYTGSNTLVCSSHANPPVDNYTWFKKANDNIVDVGHQPVFFPGDGGQYFCSAANKHGSQNSSVVTVKIKPYWQTFIRDVLMTAAVAVPFMGIIIIAVRRLRGKEKTPKTDCEEDGIEDSDYVNWLNCDNQSQERIQCERGTTEVIYTSVHFNNERQSNMRHRTDSQTDENVIYITL
ncbi:B-cell receptor CD22-like [Plectropomus leopardus]|uniref:B-cell receptor CD22-like n=1 Tax=Plectropomus leopardus TaxID=160734 RepID=UPI001C4CD2F7|nr:B-cell receptor CD22-like [Plectropomus leopardus]XP_042360071.1 B-cell receptor CD22-like [Plectropomus leopardus]